MNRYRKIWLTFSIVLVSLCLGVVVRAAGGNPPWWWDNPGDYSSWRSAQVTQEPTLVEAYELVVPIIVENDPRPDAHKQVWMQVEWGSDDDGVTVSAAEPPTIRWSYDGCDGPWEPAEPQPMEFAGDYVPEQPSDYQHGREYGTVIAPQPACEMIEVKFVDNTPTTPGNTFTIWYSIEVQTLCFDNQTSVQAHKMSATSGWIYSLAIPGTLLTALLVARRRKL